MNRHTGFLVCAVMLFFLSGCATLRFPDGPKNAPPPQYQKTERKVIKPQVLKVTHPDGSVTTSEIAYSEDYRYDISATGEKTQPNFWAWLLNPFASWWLWLFVAVIVFVPGAWGIFVWAVGRVRKRMGQVVTGVEDFLKSDAPEEAKKKLLASLSSATDVRTKKEVAQLKHKV